MQVADRSRKGAPSGVAALACWVTCAGLAAAAAAHADPGIASRYPGDAGIEMDAAVIFREDFEAGPVERVFARWDTAGPEDRMSLGGDVPAASRGRRSLVMRKQAGDGTRGARLYRRLLPEGGSGYPQVYARMYVKFAAGSDPIQHFGANLGGNHPPTRWPRVSAGERTRGDDSFWTGLEPYGAFWRWDFYTYWMEMRSYENENGSGNMAYGNAFLRETAAGSWAPAGPEVRRGEWVCVELMLKVNDPVGARNGEQAFWIDGRLVRKDGQVVSHLGPGFPRGSWLRDKWSPDPKGTPFEGFRWRSAPELLVNFVWLYVYTEEDGHDVSVSFDDLVVATRYVGPIAAGE
jgi:hypothetical protein